MTASPLFVVDPSECSRCKLCVTDCPARIITLSDSGLPEVRSDCEAECIRCQHCLAICPEGAVVLDGKRPEDSQQADPKLLPSLTQMDHLVRARRSVRQYRRENVDRNLVTQLLTSLEHAPTGVNARQLTFTTILDRAVLESLRDRFHQSILEAASAGQLGARTDGLVKMVSAWQRSGRDVLFRGAPHLLVVSAPASTPCPQQDVVLTLAYFELLAQSAGLGTVWFGYLKVVLDAVPTLKPLLGLHPDDAFYGMLFGTPAIHYARSVQREGTARIRNIGALEG
jgi:Fe-S-cluster-containing hydrogenase component 2